MGRNVQHRAALPVVEALFGNVCSPHAFYARVPQPLELEHWPLAK